MYLVRKFFRAVQVGKSSEIGWVMCVRTIEFSVSLVYYGVTYGSVDLGWNRYLTFALTSLVEFPSDYVAIWSADRLGRKKSTVIGLVVSLLASVVAISLPNDQSNKGYVAGRILMATVAKFFINLSFACIYVWTVELFPTFVRSMAFSTSSAVGKLGSFTASYVIWLIRIHSLLPYGIMGFLCLQSAIFASLLPETREQATLETMGDMNIEESGKDVTEKNNAAKQSDHANKGATETTSL